MDICRTVEFDAAHRLGDGHLHGHRYRVRAWCIGASIEDIDATVRSRILRFDHRTLLHAFDPLYLLLTEEAVAGTVAKFGIDGLDCQPTVENLAQLFFDTMWMQKCGIAEVAVELPTLSASARVPSARVQKEES